ncbi:MAG: diacylglycerol/lipid kinase family protein [Candidatus Dormibacteria bacterium]
MTAASNTLVLVNPVSAGGQTMRRWPAIRAALQRAGVPVDAHLTLAPGDATDVTRREITRRGVRRVVAVGGDGTLNEVVNGCFDERGAPLAPGLSVGLVPSGTGSDLRRTLGLPTDPDAAAQLLARGTTRNIDLGRIDFADGSRRLFVNVADCGIGGEVAARVNRSPEKRGGPLGTAIFLGVSIGELMTYHNREVLLTIDAQTSRRRVQQVVVANGRCFGGGMRIAPDADPADGLFDVVVVGDVSRAGALRAIPRLFRGTHLSLPVVEVFRGRRVVITPADRLEPPRFDVDGEQVGRAPAEISIVPGALCFAAP